jgi:hypothetical protein
MNYDLCRKCPWFHIIGKLYYYNGKPYALETKEEYALCGKYCWLSRCKMLNSALLDKDDKPIDYFEISDDCPYLLEHVMSDAK